MTFYQEYIFMSDAAGTIENDVLIGNDGYLFLAGGAHKVLEIISGRIAVPELSYKNFETNLISRVARASSQGAKFRHIIFPDKQSVLKQAFPLNNVVNLGAEYQARCSANSSSILYLNEVLSQYEETSYQRTDSHLTDKGMVIAATHIVQNLTGQDCQEYRNKLISQTTLERDVSGDLGSKLNPPRYAKERFLPVSWGAERFSNKIKGNNGIVDIWISNNAIIDSRILIFGDSFGRELTRILSFFFFECVFLRTPYFHPDILDQISPDIVITENVERYLAFTRSDEERPSFHMYPFFQASSSRS